MTTTEEYIAIGGLITICASACALVLKQVEQSRCKRIKFCCCELDRTLPNVKESQPEEEQP